MKQIFFSIIFCVIAIVLVASAPEWYSFEFCSAIFALYIAQNIIFWLNKTDRNFVCFEFFFMISFGLTNFIYPVVYYPTNPYFLMFELPFNENLISKATSIAYFGYTAYLLLLNFTETVLKRREIDIPETDTQQTDYSKTVKSIYIFLLIFLASYIISGGHTILASEYSGGGIVLDKGITGYIYMFIVATSVLLSFLMLKKEISYKHKILYSVSVFCLILFFLTLGSRTLPITLTLCVIVSYNNNIRKLSLSILLPLVIIGAVVLTFIMYARVVAFTNSNYVESALYNADINSIWDFGLDLVINNRNLYSLIDYANNYDFSYGLTMLGGLLSPIPFAQGLVCKIYNIPGEFLSSHGFNTYIDLGINSQWGLGTNLVADAYLPFGIFGVIFFFGLLGFIVAKSKIMAKYNIYWTVCYYVLVSNAVFFPRGGFFDCFRTMIWGCLIVCIITFMQRLKFINNIEK